MAHFKIDFSRMLIFQTLILGSEQFLSAFSSSNNEQTLIFSKVIEHFLSLNCLTDFLKLRKKDTPKVKSQQNIFFNTFLFAHQIQPVV
jgi:hypothetical protein